MNNYNNKKREINTFKDLVTIIIVSRKLMIKQRKLNCLFFCYEEETRTLLMIQPETLINDFFSLPKNED